MSQAAGSKEAAAVLIDPMNEPEPSAETGLNASFRSTFGDQKGGATATTTSSSTSPPSKSKNPFSSSRDKKSSHSKSKSSSTSPREPFPNYRADAFGEQQSSSRQRAGSQGTPPTYKEATSSGSNERTGRRRGSSLKERYPGDKSGEPLKTIRSDSRKAYRSPHLHKRSIPGADMVDRLDPAIGGRAYHHEGPYDAALMSRNRDPKHAPVGALESTNREALKATPQENIKDAVERHQPLDGVAAVPPGQADRFGRQYNYKEGADLMHEASSGDAGYKRWPGKDYAPDDLKGESEPTFSLDRALKAHKISENGDNSMELQDRAHLMKDYEQARRDGSLDTRDPVAIAGDDGKYVDMELAANSHDTDAHSRGHGGLGESLKKRIGSLKHKKHGE